MSTHWKQKHVIDIIFPFALLFVFAVLSLGIVLLAADIYQSTVEQSEANYESRTVLLYLTQKIHQNDKKGAVSIGTFDGHDSLMIQQSYGEKKYWTYIFEEHGVLRELFLLDGTEASAGDGKEIMKVSNLKMEQIQPGLFRFSCVSKDGKEPWIVVAALSESGELR